MRRWRSPGPASSRWSRSGRRRKCGGRPPVSYSGAIVLRRAPAEGTPRRSRRHLGEVRLARPEIFGVSCCIRGSVMRTGVRSCTSRPVEALRSTRDAQHPGGGVHRRGQHLMAHRGGRSRPQEQRTDPASAPPRQVRLSALTARSGAQGHHGDMRGWRPVIAPPRLSCPHPFVLAPSPHGGPVASCSPTTLSERTEPVHLAQEEESARRAVLVVPQAALPGSDGQYPPRSK